MVLRALDAEIRRRLSGAMNFGPDTRIAREQRTVGQRRPIFAYFGVKRITPARIDHQVICGVHPLHIWPKFGLPAQVQRQMHAQARRLGHRVNQMAEGCLAREGEVVAFGKPWLRHMNGIQTGKLPRKFRGPQPRRIDKQARSQTGTINRYQINSALRNAGVC